MPCRLNPHRSQTLPAVSFFEGFQTPAGPEKTRAHSCGRHLKPITKAGLAFLTAGPGWNGSSWIQKLQFATRLVEPKSGGWRL